jgi:hypothetical protein
MTTNAITPWSCISFSLSFILHLVYFSCCTFTFVIIFTYLFSILIGNIVFDNHLVELGTQGNTSLFYRLIEEEGEVVSTDSLRVPRVTLVEKTLLLHHSALRVPTNWCPCSLVPSTSLWRKPCSSAVIAQSKIVGFHLGGNPNLPNNAFNKDDIAKCNQ